jgi:hypothetical protein
MTILYVSDVKDDIYELVQDATQLQDKLRITKLMCLIDELDYVEKIYNSVIEKYDTIYDSMYTSGVETEPSVQEEYSVPEEMQEAFNNPPRLVFVPEITNTNDKELDKHPRLEVMYDLADDGKYKVILLQKNSTDAFVYTLYLLSIYSGVQQVCKAVRSFPKRGENHIMYNTTECTEEDQFFMSRADQNCWKFFSIADKTYAVYVKMETSLKYDILKYVIKFLKKEHCIEVKLV